MTSATRQTIAIGGSIDTSYLSAGDRANPTIVLIHDGGFGSDAESCWRLLIEALSDRYHLVAPDLLGHGSSSKVYFFDRPASVQRMQQVASLCEAVGVSEAAFVGASHGGSMVLEAATAAAPLWPITRAVSIAGSGGRAKRDEAFERIRAIHPSADGARELLGCLVEDPSEHVAEIGERHRRFHVPGHWETLNAARLRNPAIDHPPPSARTPGTASVPVLLIEGADDPLLHPGWAAGLAQELGATAVTVPGRHCPHLDRPVLVASVIDDFLRGGGVDQR